MYSQKLKNMFKMLLGQTYADRDIKTIAVRDGRRSRKQASVSFVSRSIDLILLKHYFIKIHNTV